MGLWPLPSRRGTIINAFFQKIHSLRASDAFLLRIAFFLSVVFLFAFLIQLSMKYATPTPSFGGTFREGIVGTPRFANPVLAVTRADKDLSALVYDGLMKIGKNGELIPNIAESVTVSDDGLTYNITIKNNVTFHDGTSLTARDIAFTIAKIQDPVLNSPLRPSFDGVVVEELGEYEFNIILNEPYAPFVGNLTFGILPHHIWTNAVSEEFPFSQYNSEPVGSGPYKVTNIVRNTSGIPEKYTLAANETYHGGTPKIAIVELTFFTTEPLLAEAFRKGLIDSVVGIDAQNLQAFALKDETHHLERIPLPRTFAIFINQNKSPALRDLAAREALNVAIDRQALVDLALGGFGNVLSSPIPVGFRAPDNVSLPQAGTDAARDILRSGGWEMNEETHVWEKEIDDVVTPLRFSISTGNSPTLLEKTSEYVRDAWLAIGADVTIKQFEQADFNQTVIRPRDYETILFGNQFGRSLDLYSFWHSSQRNDPGLNLALYTNITTDSILSEMRRDVNQNKDDAIKRFSEEITKEVPAIFLFSPELLYIFPNKVTGATFRGVGEQHERFSNINEWYIETESIWPIFKQ